MNLYIEKMKSEKSNKEYIALVADMGFVKQVISYDVAIMTNLANLAPSDFYKKLETVGSKIILIKSEIK